MFTLHGRIHVHYLVYLQTEIALGTVRLFKAVSFTLSIREIPDIKTVKHLVDHLNKSSGALHAGFLIVRGIPHPVGDSVSYCSTHDLLCEYKMLSTH